MRYSKINYSDKENGEGTRVSIQITQNDQAPLFTEEEQQKILIALESKDIEGLSIYGDDPLLKTSHTEILKLITAFREKFDFNKTIWLWTNYSIDQITNDERQWMIASAVDVMVDGGTVSTGKVGNLMYRDSSDQLIIDMQASQTFNTLILKEEYMNN